MVHDRLVPAAARALGRAGAGARRAPPPPALAVVVPAEQRAARLARLEAQVARRVREERQHARADHARERVAGEVERLERVEREDERRHVCGGRRLRGGASVDRDGKTGERGGTHQLGSRGSR